MRRNTRAEEGRNRGHRRHRRHDRPEPPRIRPRRRRPPRPRWRDPKRLIDEESEERNQSNDCEFSQDFDNTATIGIAALVTQDQSGNCTNIGDDAELPEPAPARWSCRSSAADPAQNQSAGGPDQVVRAFPLHLHHGSDPSSDDATAKNARSGA
jgi:hypothetical protein